MSLASGDVEVFGNVRYIGPEHTMYGSKLNYNFNSEKLDIYNGRILSDNYVVLAKKFSRLSPSEIYGQDAEYTTCRDCPESWSIFGREVNITVGEYVRIQGAYIKAKGVVVMYIPYIILPIKKNRESGLLFPSFGLNLVEGARFQQPYFWAITEQMDMTITPSYFGNRGFGGELEFRHAPFDGFWYQTEGLFTNDGIYLPGKENRDVSGTKEFRFLGQWEHHFNTTSDFNHHFRYTNTRDFDFQRDYQFYTNNRIFGPDTGLDTMFEWRKDLFHVGLEGGFRENLLFSEARDFDDRYVQILPKLNFDLNPNPILQTSIPGLNKIILGGNLDYTIFKQNKASEQQFIRNAHRVNAQPYLSWNLGQFGPVGVRTKAKLDYQYYRFPTLERQNWFRKHSIVYETEAMVTADKVFGLAFNEVVPGERLINKESKVKSNDEKLIGGLPEVKGSDDKIKVIRSSYRHRQRYKLKHYFLSDQQSDGNLNFYNQIQQDNGQFDPLDTIRSREFLASNITSKTTLPLNNTVEIQWSSTLDKKVSKKDNILRDNNYLIDNFDYSNVAYFNVSQGYDLYRKRDDLGRELPFDERLTRLFLNTGFSIRNTSISISEYYYYATQESILNATVSQGFGLGSLSTSLRYNSFRVPSDKFVNFRGNIQLFGLLSLSGNLDFDMEAKRTNQLSYGLLYTPTNNCWRLSLDYLKTIAEKRFSFNFLINFSGDGFTGLRQQ